MSYWGSSYSLIKNQRDDDDDDYDEDREEYELVRVFCIEYKYTES